MKFLQDVGFSQVVLARELSLAQIREISAATSVQLEFFIHGALCVSYSGQCNISHARTGRSANRGECAQLCRLPCSLQTPGEVLVENSHLLSLKDMDQTDNLEALIAAGSAPSRLKGASRLDYVKNVTAWYRQKLDTILASRPDLVAASAGRCSYTFTPDPKKSFNRGSTDYFLHGRQPGIDSPRSPKYVGEPLGRVTSVTRDGIEIDGQAVALNNGDGLGFFKPGASWWGCASIKWRRRHRASGYSCRNPCPVSRWAPRSFRNHDQAFSKQLERERGSPHPGRYAVIGVRRGTAARTCGRAGHWRRRHAPLRPAAGRQPGTGAAACQDQLGKLGNTLFVARQIELAFTRPLFIAASQLNGLRREASPPWRRPVWLPPATRAAHSPRRRLSPASALLPRQRAEQRGGAVLSRTRGGEHRPRV